MAARQAKDFADRATPVAKERAGESARRAKELTVRATPVVKERAATGKALVDEKLAERRAAAEQRARWYLGQPGPLYTAGYPDEETMRRGIQAAAEHGWAVDSTTAVPARRGPAIGLPGSLSGALAKQALTRIRKPDRFLVTFRKSGEGTAGGSAAARAPGSDGDSGPTDDVDAGLPR